MTHSPISLTNVSHSFEDKLCFEPFSKVIYPSTKIAIIGRNGSGKSTLLKIIEGVLAPSGGSVHIPQGIVIGYVPQLVTEHSYLSGSQRFNKTLSQELAKHPDVLCLDEPTNHLDAKNRIALMRMLKQFRGTLIVVSHDVELLRNCVDEIWHIDNHKVSIFSGTYDDYLYEHELKQAALEEKLEQLIKEKKHGKQALVQEQQRVARSKHAHKDEPDRKLRGKMKQTASNTEGKNKGKIIKQLDRVTTELKDIHIPKEIKPTFTLSTTDCSPNKTIVSVADGTCGYNTTVLHDIHFHLKGGERVALLGDNGSGKTTFIKAILQDKEIKRSGQWMIPPRENIGYIDQHYATLNHYDTVLDAIHDVAPRWTTHEMRKHLNDFLFSKNEQVHTAIQTLSGGERARLSLAQIAAQSPKLLILDEITNNVDRETKEHILKVLNEYPGAIIVISHDQDFLQALTIDTYYSVENGTLKMSI